MVPLASKVAAAHIRGEVWASLEAADELRGLPPVRESANFRSPAWRGLLRLVRHTVELAGSKLWDRYVVPVMEDAYDEHMEDLLEDWCEDHQCSSVEEVPRSVRRQLYERAVKEVRGNLTRRSFIQLLLRIWDSLNPANIVRSLITAFRKHGLKLGLRAALIILIGDLILPGLGGLISPALFGILSITPHTEIALAVLVASSAEDDVNQWLEEYESLTGEDLVLEYNLRA